MEELKTPIRIVFEEASQQALAYDGTKIIPLCSYAQRLMIGKDDYQDVLA